MDRIKSYLFASELQDIGQFITESLNNTTQTSKDIIDFLVYLRKKDLAEYIRNNDITEDQINEISNDNFTRKYLLWLKTRKYLNQSGLKSYELNVLNTNAGLEEQYEFNNIAYYSNEETIAEYIVRYRDAILNNKAGEIIYRDENTKYSPCKIEILETELENPQGILCYEINADPNRVYNILTEADPNSDYLNCISKLRFRLAFNVPSKYNNMLFEQLKSQFDNDKPLDTYAIREILKTTDIQFTVQELELVSNSVNVLFRTITPIVYNYKAEQLQSIAYNQNNNVNDKKITDEVLALLVLNKQCLEYFLSSCSPEVAMELMKECYPHWNASYYLMLRVLQDGPFFIINFTNLLLEQMPFISIDIVVFLYELLINLQEIYRTTKQEEQALHYIDECVGNLITEASSILNCNLEKLQFSELYSITEESEESIEAFLEYLRNFKFEIAYSSKLIGQLHYEEKDYAFISNFEYELLATFANERDLLKLVRIMEFIADTEQRYNMFFSTISNLDNVIIEPSASWNLELLNNLLKGVNFFNELIDEEISAIQEEVEYQKEINTSVLAIEKTEHEYKIFCDLKILFEQSLFKFLDNECIKSKPHLFNLIKSESNASNIMISSRADYQLFDYPIDDLFIDYDQSFTELQNIVVKHNAKSMSQEYAKSYKDIGKILIAKTFLTRFLEVNDEVTLNFMLGLSNNIDFSEFLYEYCIFPLIRYQFTYNHTLKNTLEKGKNNDIKCVQSQLSINEEQLAESLLYINRYYPMSIAEEELLELELENIYNISLLQRNAELLGQIVRFIRELAADQCNISACLQEVISIIIKTEQKDCLLKDNIDLLLLEKVCTKYNGFSYSCLVRFPALLNSNSELEEKQLLYFKDFTRKFISLLLNEETDQALADKVKEAMSLLCQNLHAETAELYNIDSVFIECRIEAKILQQLYIALKTECTRQQVTSVINCSHRYFDLKFSKFIEHYSVRDFYND